MTRYEVGHRLLDDIEKHNERAVAKFEMQVNLLGAYRDQLEDHVDIAAEMLSKATGCSQDGALALIADEYELRQARKVEAP